MVMVMNNRQAKLCALVTALLFQNSISAATMVTRTNGKQTAGLRGRERGGEASRGNKGSHEGERQRKLRELESTPGTRIFARYKSRRGHQLLALCARKIVQDEDNDDIMIIEGNGNCMNRIQNDPEIFDFDFDFPVKAFGGSSHDVLSERMLNNEIGAALPWGLGMINADQLPMGQYDIKVCVVDSGIAIGHPDFASTQIDGEDNGLFYRDTWMWDHDLIGHGTKVAGIINSVGVNSPGFSMFITRGLGDNGEGYESDVRTAVEQCVSAGANIINLSLGGTDMSNRSRRYYKQVVEDMGIIMIGAAGNDGTESYMYPAAHPSVISVSAVYEWGGHWGYSNYGDQVELAAPGHRVPTTTIMTSSILGGRDGDTNLLGTIDDADNVIEGYHLPGTRTDTVAAPLTYCENGDKKCNKAERMICLMAREMASLESMLENCEESQGVGAVIFDPKSDEGIGAWQVSSSSSGTGGAYIPAMVVSLSTGLELLHNMLNQNVVIDTRTDGTAVTFSYEQSSGTSFAAPQISRGGCSTCQGEVRQVVPKKQTPPRRGRDFLLHPV